MLNANDMRDPAIWQTDLDTIDELLQQYSLDTHEGLMKMAAFMGKQYPAKPLLAFETPLH